MFCAIISDAKDLACWKKCAKGKEGIPLLVLLLLLVLITFNAAKFPRIWCLVCPPCNLGGSGTANLYLSELWQESFLRIY